MRWASAGHSHGAAEAGAGSACPRLVQHDCEGHAENHFVVHGGCPGFERAESSQWISVPCCTADRAEVPERIFLRYRVQGYLCPTHAHGKLVAAGQSPKPGTVRARSPRVADLQAGANAEAPPSARAVLRR